MMKMSQHFLLSAAARTLSLKEVYGMGEHKAYETFAKAFARRKRREPVAALGLGRL